MKTLIFLLLASFWGLDLPALPTNIPLKEDTLATEGTQFRDLSFDEALAAARAEGKLLFVDCYTTWCGPCRNMAEKVFPQKAPNAGRYTLTPPSSSSARTAPSSIAWWEAVTWRALSPARRKA